MNPRHELVNFFRKIQLNFSRYYTRVLTRMDLTLPQFALLALLAHSGPLAMSEAGRKLHVTKPAVTYLTKQLARKKYLKRKCLKKDQRVCLLEISPRGENRVRQTQSHILNFLFKTLEQFPEHEQRTIIRFYGQLAQTIEGLLVKESTPHAK